MKQATRWYDHLWIVTILYLGLGFFNILFAWLGLIFFFLPLILSLAGQGKIYCNRYCDRGQFLALLGGRLGLSRRRDIPRWMRSRGFRYGFLIFFFVMFCDFKILLAFPRQVFSGKFRLDCLLE